jgi:hypothetical protein
MYIKNIRNIFKHKVVKTCCDKLSTTSISVPYVNKLSRRESIYVYVYYTHCTIKCTPLSIMLYNVQTNLVLLCNQMDANILQLQPKAQNIDLCVFTLKLLSLYNRICSPNTKFNRFTIKYPLEVLVMGQYKLIQDF